MLLMVFVFGYTTETQIGGTINYTDTTCTHEETEGTNESASSLHAAQSQSRQLWLELWQ